MLQSWPITAPGSTWAKAQTRVPDPMRSPSTSAFGWKNTPGISAVTIECLLRAHDLVRTSLRIFEGAPHVATHEPEAEPVQAPEEGYQQDGARAPGDWNGGEQLSRQHLRGKDQAAQQP